MEWNSCKSISVATGYPWKCYQKMGEDDEDVKERKWRYLEERMNRRVDNKRDEKKKRGKERKSRVGSSSTEASCFFSFFISFFIIIIMEMSFVMNFLMDCQTKGKQLLNDDVGEIESVVKKECLKQWNSKENNRSKPNNETWSSWEELRQTKCIKCLVYGNQWITSLSTEMTKQLDCNFRQKQFVL